MGKRRLTNLGGWWSYTRAAPATSTKAPKPRRTTANRKPTRSSVSFLFPTPPPTNPINFTPTFSTTPSSNTPTSQTTSLTVQPLSALTPMAPPSSPTLASAIEWYNTDPETKSAYEQDPYLNGTSVLEYPPHTSKLCWKNRCFKCLIRGHPLAQCRAPVRACSRCRRPGHGPSDCPKEDVPQKTAKPGHSQHPKDVTALLKPRGNLGDSKMPKDRPTTVDFFIPQSADSIDNLHYLSKGVVVDARIKGDALCSESIQAALLTFSPKSGPFPLIRMTNHRYLLLLRENLDRATFIASIRSNLESIGLVIYPWSPAIDAEPITYRYKVWLDLIGMPIHSWNKQHLLPLIGQFGLLLEHTPFSKVSSIEKLRVLVAVRYLEDVPKSARSTVRFMRTPVPVEVVGWVEEPMSVRPPTDTTPPSSYFKEAERRLRSNPPPTLSRDKQGSSSYSVILDFDVAFDAWFVLPPGDYKKRLGAKLQQSPFWSMARYKARLESLPQPPPPLPLPQALDPLVPTAEDTVDHTATTNGLMHVRLATDNPTENFSNSCEEGQPGATDMALDPIVRMHVSSSARDSPDPLDLFTKPMRASADKGKDAAFENALLPSSPRGTGSVQGMTTPSRHVSPSRTPSLARKPTARAHCSTPHASPFVLRPSPPCASHAPADLISAGPSVPLSGPYFLFCSWACGPPIVSHSPFSCAWLYTIFTFSTVCHFRRQHRRAAFILRPSSSSC